MIVRQHWALVHCAVIAISPMAFAQSSSTPSVSAGKAPASSPIEPSAPAAPPAAAASRPPLLPDRSDVAGLVVRIERTPMGGLVAMPQRKYLGTVERRAPLLPSPVLADFRAAIDQAKAPVWFRLNGIVTTYRGVNFIVPTFATRLDGAPAVAVAGPLLPPGGGAPVDVARVGRTSGPARATTPAATASPDRAAGDAEARLDAALGEGASAPENVAERLERGLEQRVGQAPRSGAVASADGPPPAPVRALQRQRCTIERDASTGAWYALTFDHDLGAQRRMQFVPCAALQRIEEAARLAPVGTAMLLSGACWEADGGLWVLPDRAEPLKAGRGVKP
ncbi:MAG: hypothetical protein ACO3DS_11125 [Phycisphaerales bacterium]